MCARCSAKYIWPFHPHSPRMSAFFCCCLYQRQLCSNRLRHRHRRAMLNAEETGKKKYREREREWGRHKHWETIYILLCVMHHHDDDGFGSHCFCLSVCLCACVCVCISVVTCVAVCLSSHRMTLRPNTTCIHRVTIFVRLRLCLFVCVCAVRLWVHLRFCCDGWTHCVMCLSTLCICFKTAVTWALKTLRNPSAGAGWKTQRRRERKCCTDRLRLVRAVCVCVCVVNWNHHRPRSFGLRLFYCFFVLLSCCLFDFLGPMFRHPSTMFLRAPSPTFVAERAIMGRGKRERPFCLG